MSYEIEYRYAAFAFDGQRAYRAINDIAEAAGERTHYPDYSSRPCAVTFVEHGSNNTYTSDNKRARSWNLQHAGQHADVMRRIIHASEFAESGMTQPNNRYQKAESYIAANRKRLAAALPLDKLFDHIQGTTLAFSVHSFNEERAAEHPWWQQAVANGRTYVPRYRELHSGVRVQVDSLLTLECLLLTIAEIGDGECGTIASMGDTCRIPWALNRLSDEKDFSRLCG